MAKMIDCESIAEEIETKLKEVSDIPKLEIILIGCNESSEVFVEEKMKACERVGFEAELTRFESDVDEEKLLDHIIKKNEDASVHGILVQLPLPEHIDEERVFNTITPLKDVDGLTPVNIGKLLRGKPKIKPSCVSAIEKILEKEKSDLNGENITIINNSNLIGKPLAMLLTQKGATVTICNENTENLKTHTKNADIVIVAAGEPKLLSKNHVSSDALLIDAGYAYVDGKIIDEMGDALEKSKKATPVPGGVGPVTVATTLENLLDSYLIQKQ